MNGSQANRLGEGSYGCVYKGINTSTGMEVAIKKVPVEKLKTDEIALMRSLGTCEYLMGLIDCVSDHWDTLHTYIVMELCDSDLARHLTIEGQEGKLRECNFRVVLHSLAAGYATLYQEKIVHRDIKPQNILLRYTRPPGYEPYTKIATAKITDFGVSRALVEPPQSPTTANKEPSGSSDVGFRRAHSSPSLRSVAGTPYYMAPEVGANLVGDYEYDYGVDMWSIGCVLYQCVTGHPPFDEPGLCRLFLKAACFNFGTYQCPELPTAPDTPENLRRILQSLLQIDPEKRLTPPEFYSAAKIYTNNHRRIETTSCNSVSEPSGAKMVNSKLSPSIPPRSQSKPSIPAL